MNLLQNKNKLGQGQT